jgi:protein tyrosine phosphatase (PTP) superfamily phosphohydrolase (DUF442 family)
MNHRRMTILILAIPFVAMAAAGFLVWRQYFETYHLATVDEGKLYRDGNRGPRELATALRKVEPRTVVCLIDDEELSDKEKPEFAAEVELLQREGVNLIRVPVKLGGWPTASDIDSFLKIASDSARQPVLVHCAQGVRRTGMMVAAYQQSVLGWDDKKTEDAILVFGHSERSIGDVRRFIRVYDPQKREMTETLAQSKE